MSIDLFTARNPSYCFVELTDKAQAERAIQKLNGANILGRPVKLGPGVASRFRQRQRIRRSKSHDRAGQPIYQRWTRTDAPKHFKGYSEEGRRLWVGGLPKMPNHYAVEGGIRELFAGFDMYVPLASVLIS